MAFRRFNQGGPQFNLSGQGTNVTGGFQSPQTATGQVGNIPFSNAPDPIFFARGNPKAAAAQLSNVTLPFLSAGALQSLPQGLDTLNQILASQGQTDPAMFNRQLADISQQSQQRQQQQQSLLAGLGLQGSGIGQAQGAAIGLSGANQRAGAIAREQQLAEARRRQDLDLLLQLIINPALGATGMRINAPQGQSSGTLDALIGGGGAALQGYLAGQTGGASTLVS